ncbi:hypothetical protein ZWY2020_035739 [Hordeum vulgare]|nr:hypothetical protein ZWY2020_035739 [Hordeum vulgare]
MYLLNFHAEPVLPQPSSASFAASATFSSLPFPSPKESNSFMSRLAPMAGDQPNSNIPEHGSLISLVLCCSHGIGAAMALCAHAGARGKPSRTSLPPHAKASYLIGAPQRRHCSPEHTVNHPDAIGNGTSIK